MILEFTCENYKSIKHESKLSMIATKDKEHKESLLYYKNKPVLPIISIYGANGAGKTNILQAIGFLNFMVSNSNRFEPGDNLPFLPHKLSDKNESTFSIQISIDEIRYAYGFSNNESEILTEYLYHFKSNKQAKIFEREKENYSFGKEYIKDLKDLKEKMSKKNKLFLSLAASWINNPDIINVFEYLKNDIIINTVHSNEEWKKQSLMIMRNNPEYKDAFITFLKALDINVTDIDIEVQNIKFNYEDLPQNMPEELKMILSKGEGIDINTKLKYNDLEIDLNEESVGINKLFEIGIPLLDIFKSGKVLIYDELETSIHPILVKNIIKMFKNQNLNSKNGQLIFTTHDSNLLDLDLLRRDQIWFAEKDDTEKSTRLYSLSDLRNIRNDENIENGYIRGKYGSIPFINNEYIEKFNTKKDTIHYG